MSQAMRYYEISGQEVHGENIKVTGERRTWHAKTTGRFRRGARYDRQIEVRENKRVKWISIETFTGTIGDTQLVEGRCKDGSIPFNLE